MRTSESIAAIAKAMAGFQSEVKQPEKDGKNPHFKSNYVTLDGTVKAIHDTAPKFGLSYIQSLVTNERGTGVITLILHESGEFIEMDPFFLPMEKQTAQGAGSAATYSRRYSLSAAFGIVSDLDDDGNEATKQAGNPPAEKPISAKQVGLIKVKVGELAKLHNMTPAEVYQKVNTTETGLEKLSSKQASELITILDRSIEKIQNGA